MIKINYDYHVIELGASLPGSAYDWLVEKLGQPNGDKWFYRWPRIYFSDSKDHLMFILRWGA